MFLILLYVDWHKMPRCCVISSGFTPLSIYSSALSGDQLTSDTHSTSTHHGAPECPCYIPLIITNYMHHMMNLGALDSNP